MWIDEAAAANKKQEMTRQQKERVGTTMWYVLRANDGVKDDPDRYGSLLQGVREFSNSFKHRKACVSVDRDEFYFYSYHETQDSFTMNIVENTQVIFDKILAHAEIVTLIIMTWPDEIDFWKNIGTYIPCDNRLHVLTTLNERNEENFLLDLPLPTVEELTKGSVGSLSVEVAEQIISTMNAKDHKPVKSEESIVHVASKVKEGVLDDPSKRSDMERLVKEFAVRAQTATGTIACGFGYIAAANEYHFMIQYDSLSAFHINLGWCGAIASELNVKYVDLQRFEALCGSEEAVKFFEQVGKEYKPAEKLLVRQYGNL